MQSRLPAPARRSAIPTFMHGQLAGIGQIYFQTTPLFGLVFLLSLYMSRPMLALGCLLGVCAASATAYAAGFPEERRQLGLYSFNAALSGIGLSAFYQTTPALVAWIAFAAVLSAVLTHALRNARLPVLTFQFVVVMWVARVYGPAFGLQELSESPANCLEAPLVYMSCAFGQVSFISLAPLGMLMWAALALHRWHMAMWALGGALGAWAFAFGGELLLPGVGFGAQATGIGANAVLVMLALHEHRRHWALRLLGAGVASLLCLGIGASGLPYFTLPFVLATWAVLAFSQPAPSKA